jgi:hypothetical protein
MPSFAVYEVATGSLFSSGTVVADPLPSHLAAKALREQEAAHLAAGGLWDAAALTVLPPAAAVPASVTARQIRLWLVSHGVSLAAVDAAIDAIQDATQREMVRVEWEYAPYVERSHPMLLPLASALGMTVAQVDAAFLEAAAL